MSGDGKTHLKMAPENENKEGKDQVSSNTKTSCTDDTGAGLHENKMKHFSGDEDEVNSMKKKRKQRSSSVSDDDDDDDEQPGPSSQVTPDRRKEPKKLRFSSRVKNDEKNDIWTWPLYKSQLPVTCGDLRGTLKKSRLAKGEACILFQKQWFTPGEFEKLAGKKSCKNWKWSIRCNGTTLGKLIQEGHLEAAPYKGGAKKTKKSLFPSDVPNTVSDREENENEEAEDQFSSNDKESSTDDTEDEEETEQQPETDDDSSIIVFKVTCETLRQITIASGTRGKSIRTETRWMSPEEFVEEESGQTDGSWKKDIKCEGKPLGNLIEQENQKNDVECCVCKRDEDAELVVCDYCPRSFHQRCHLPYVDDTILKENGKWMCTFCVLGCYTYIDEMEMNEALSRQISGRMLQCQYLLLHLCCADEEQTFAADPNLTLSDYSTVIQTPMWLSQVANKVQTREYETVGEFVSDVNLIFTNFTKYNQNNTEVCAKGNQLKELFDREFRSVFNIRE
ncbi:Nuclear body protein SP140-like protein [Channa argus]|uniref:Nuclear body protein SP140-like protein n=1 Tax=Channa argus TaxID=215402 RepID=A0A6G1QDM7_CHAAH|nr:Nuclear body protein SP140-like protein [Channa argus]